MRELKAHLDIDRSTEAVSHTWNKRDYWTSLIFSDFSLYTVYIRGWHSRVTFVYLATRCFRRDTTRFDDRREMYWSFKLIILVEMVIVFSCDGCWKGLLDLVIKRRFDYCLSELLTDLKTVLFLFLVC